MKIMHKSRAEADLDRYDYRDAYEIEIDGKTVFSVHDGEPEDNSLGRNFNDCYRITSLLKRAYEAGKNGEEFTIEATDLTD